MNSRILTSVVSLVIATVSTTTANPIAAQHTTGCTYSPTNISVEIDLDGNAVPANNLDSPVAFTADNPSDQWFYTESLSVGTGDPVVYGAPFVDDDNWYVMANVPSSVAFDFGEFFETQISRFGVFPRVGDIIKVTRGFRYNDPTGPQAEYDEVICELTITYTVIPTPPPPRIDLGRCWDSLEIWMSCRTPAALPQTV